MENGKEGEEEGECGFRLFMRAGRNQARKEDFGYVASDSKNKMKKLKAVRILKMDNAAIGEVGFC